MIGDGTYIKKMNRDLILQEIFTQKKISRANLSKKTGLNKATISSQVGDLIKDHFIFETQEKHSGLGRRPILLSINEESAYFLGIDLDYENILFNVMNLKGDTVLFEKVDLFSDIYEEIVELLANKISQYKTIFADSTYGLAQVTIGIHGTVSTDETIYFIPKYQWREKDLKKDLMARGIKNVYIENNANLSAYAEKVFYYHQSNHLLNITLSTGIGAGIIINGNLQKGYNGHAGEIGHMIVYPKGRPCRCGNEGCWERYASEPALLNRAKHVLPVNISSHADLEKLVDNRDKDAIKVINDWLADVSIGLNNIINIYNPEMIVLNSPILNFYPHALEELDKYLVSSVSNYHKIAVSELGGKAGVVGACAIGIQRFMGLPQLSLLGTNNITVNEANL